MGRTLLCLVTDRRRLCASIGRPASDWREPLLEQIRGAVAGAIDLVQIREHDLEAKDLAELVRQAVALASGSAARVIVNDRVDVAIAAGAAGVHLREDSLSAAQARRLAPEGFMVGRSIHSVDGALQAPFVDYLIAGTVFPTASKSGSERLLGIDGLAAVANRAGTTPVLAIGGVTAERVSAIARAGAAGFAAIGAFFPEAETVRLAESVRELVERLRFGFDSGSTVF